MYRRTTPRTASRVPQAFQDDLLENEAANYFHYDHYAPSLLWTTMNDYQYIPSIIQVENLLDKDNYYLLNYDLTPVQSPPPTGLLYSVIPVQMFSINHYNLQPFPCYPLVAATNDPYWENSDTATCNEQNFPPHSVMAEHINSYPLNALQASPFYEMRPLRSGLDAPDHDPAPPTSRDPPKNDRVYKSEEGYLVEEPPSTDSEGN